MRDANTMREMLLADLALAQSVAPVEVVARAIQEYWARKDHGGPGFLDALQQRARIGDATIDRLQGLLAAALEPASGDAELALAMRGGIDATIHHQLTVVEAPLARALMAAGVGARAPLRTVPEERYLDFEKIGRGGMGLVFLALDTELNRRVALKVVRPDRVDMEESESGSPLSLLPPDADSPGAADFRSLTTRFLQEAWVTGGLEHPGIIPVYELGLTPAGVPFYTMRFVSGKRTLDVAISEAQGLPDRLELLEPLLKICDTMSYAHSRGVIHRDLKPANVALGEFGEVVVLDWGLARLMDRPDVAEPHWQRRLREFREGADLETAVGAVGTPGYMSPEAAAGDPSRLDPQSDVYSLGVILYVLLTGRLPYEFGSFPEFVKKLLGEVPPAPTRLEPAAPAGLSSICLRAIARKHKERTASAGELAAEIRAWQRESALQREVEVLLAEARAGLRSAEGLRGDALLRQEEQVHAACAGVLRLRADDGEAREILEACSVLRRRAVAEQGRTSRRLLLRRLSLVGAIFLIIAAGTVLWLFDSRRRIAEAGERRATTLKLAAEAGKRRAQATALNAAAREAAVTDPMLGLILVREAALVEPLPEVMTTLCDLLVATREVVNLRGHEAWVQSAVYSPDGGLILTASGDHTARLWSREGIELARFTGHRGVVAAAAFSPDGTLVLTASRDRTARLFDLAGNELAVMEGHGQGISTAVFSRTEDRVLTASSDGTARLFDLEGNAVAVFSGHAGPVLSAVFSPDGKLVLTASSDATARLWRLDGTEVAVLVGHEDRVWTAAFSPDGDEILTSSSDATARRWDLAGRVLAVFEGHAAGLPVTTATFSPDGRTILTAGADRTARLWNPDGKQVGLIRDHASPVTVARFSPDGELILTASEDKTCRLWSRDGEELMTFRGHGEEILSAAFSPDGQEVVTAARDGTARTWALHRFGEVILRVPGTTFEAAAFSPNGQFILTGQSDGSTRLWELGGRPVIEVPGRRGATRAVAFSPNGQAFAAGSNDGTVRVWDLAGRELAVLNGHESWLEWVEFSPDGRFIATSSRDGTARIWDLPGRLQAMIEDHVRVVHSVRFSPNGDRLLTASADWTAGLFDLRGRLIRWFEGHGLGCGTAVFSPDGKWVLTGSEDRTARLWPLPEGPPVLLEGQGAGVDVAVFSPGGDRILTCSHFSREALIWDLEGKIVGRLEGHQDFIRTAVFHPRDPIVLTGSLDGTARLWDLEGRNLWTYPGHRGGISIARFSPDGNRVLTAGRDGTARIWQRRPADLLEVARLWISREMTDLEQDRYAHLLDPR